MLPKVGNGGPVLSARPLPCSPDSKLLRAAGRARPGRRPVARLMPATLTMVSLLVANFSGILAPSTAFSCPNHRMAVSAGQNFCRTLILPDRGSPYNILIIHGNLRAHHSQLDDAAVWRAGG